jgi:3-oxoadipate enol-lactonase
MSRRVLYVHGFPLDRTMWDAQVAALGGEAIDLPGFGQAPPMDGPLTMDRLAEAVAAAIGEEPADLVGFSMGGFALLALWALRPELVRSLALVGTRATADDEAGRARRDEQAELLRRSGPAALADVQLPSLVAEAAPETVRRRLRAMIEGTRPETILAALAALRDRPDRTAMLPDISVPVLLVGGEQDRLAAPALLRDAASRLPDATLVLVPGVGHTVPMEAPDELNRALRGFWDQNPPAGEPS